MLAFTVFVKMKIFIKCLCHQTSSPKKLERFMRSENQKMMLRIRIIGNLPK